MADRNTHLQDEPVSRPKTCVAIRFNTIKMAEESLTNDAPPVNHLVATQTSNDDELVTSLPANPSQSLFSSQHKFDVCSRLKTLG